jgi:hypothetical protein
MELGGNVEDNDFDKSKRIVIGTPTFYIQKRISKYEDITYIIMEKTPVEIYGKKGFEAEDTGHEFKSLEQAESKLAFLKSIHSSKSQDTMELGGNIKDNDFEKLLSKAHTNLTVKMGRPEYAPNKDELQEEIDKIIMEKQFGSNNI